MGNSQVVHCAFCGSKKFPEMTKPGMMTPLTQSLPITTDAFGRGVHIVIEIPPPVICFDCIIKYYEEIEAANNASVNLLLKDGVTRIIFDGKRWYIHETDNGKKYEVLRSYAYTTLDSNDLLSGGNLSIRASLDVGQSDQPLLLTEQPS